MEIEFERNLWKILDREQDRVVEGPWIWSAYGVVDQQPFGLCPLSGPT